MSKLSFGIIGCGRVVQELHLPAWKLIPEAQLVAVCDANRAALQAVSAQQPGVRHYTTVDALLADAYDLDFVVLATPGFSHLAIGEQVLRQKLHLLCEKPLALGMRDAEHLFNVADQEGVVLIPIHNYRYRANVLAARARAAQGVLGDVVSVSVRFRSGSLFDEPVRWMRQERLHRTLLFDFAYHYIDLALLFLGPVSSLRFVEAETDSLGLQSVVFGTLHQHGARGFFELMLDASCCRTEIEVLGESCGLALDFFPDGFRMLPRRDTPLHRGIADARQCVQFALHRVKQQLPRSISYRVLPHARVFRAFVDALRRGGATTVPRAEVLQTIALLSGVAERAYSADPTEQMSTTSSGLSS